MSKPSPVKILESKTNFSDRFVPDHAELDKLVKEFKKWGVKIVLTQGVYDLIHEGHALYLEAAKSHGDILIVGVDSDELTKLRKGPSRPIVPQNERVKMLVHLRHVDIVTIRDAKSDIGELIRLIKPDVLITSSSTKDFKKDLGSGKYNKYCGKIVVLPPQATISTTARIRNLAIEGAETLAKEIQKLTQDFLDNIRKSS
ncbi:MAG TPA: adenylyltransferase/cytidyltransferase family protein [Candidatus Tyrphobacter sp.]|nr:adenylyltransferase/cytidyltransferase family protein [Candidatus Tyrphobacter sp.]